MLIGAANYPTALRMASASGRNRAQSETWLGPAAQHRVEQIREDLGHIRRQTVRIIDWTERRPMTSPGATVGMAARASLAGAHSRLKRQAGMDDKEPPLTD